MRFFLFMALAAGFLPLTGQSPAPGARDTITIPGTDIRFIMVYVPAGHVPVGGDGQTVEVGGFWIGQHEVTQQEYALFQHRDRDNDASDWQEGEFSADAVTRPSPPYTDITFGMGSGGDFPAVSMTQQAALFYCYWLYTKTGKFFRLPTEAEWRYACLAGAGEKTAGEDEAWHFDNSEERYRTVGQKKPNAWGLFDMMGNVAEWTLDQYVEDYAGTVAAAQPVGPWSRPQKRYGRTVMGGSFDDPVEDCSCQTRVASSVQWQKRDPQIPKSLWWNTDASFVGFRLVIPADEMDPDAVESFFGEAIQW